MWSGQGLFSNVVHAGEIDFFCPNSEEGRVLFANKKLSEYPYYAEPKIGGTRVQKQHPQTYLFGQAKFLISNGSGVVVCNYSNHVGLVALFAYVGVVAPKVDEKCTNTNCENEVHWRNEHTYSTIEEDIPGQETINVCVHTKDGIDYPSTGLPI